MVSFILMAFGFPAFLFSCSSSHCTTSSPTALLFYAFSLWISNAFARSDKREARDGVHAPGTSEGNILLYSNSVEGKEEFDTSRADDTAPGSITSEASWSEGARQGKTVHDNNSGYSPMGLQVWSNEKSFLEALRGGRLVLVVMLAPWCDRGAKELTFAASKAAGWLDKLALLSSLHSDSHPLPSEIDDVDQIWHNFNNWKLPSGLKSMPPVPRPLIGTMDATSVPNELRKSLGPVTAYPALKFVLTFSRGEGQEGGSHFTTKNVHENDNAYYEGEIVMWDYIGPREAAKDLFDSVLLYWYRFVVSNALERYSSHSPFEEPTNYEDSMISTSFSSFESSNINMGKASATFDEAEAKPPIFSFSSHHKLLYFLKNHGERILRPVNGHYPNRSRSSLERELFEFYMGGAQKEDVSGIFQNYEIPDGRKGAANGTTYCNMSSQGHESYPPDEGNCFGPFNLKTTKVEIDPYILLVQCRLSSGLGEAETDLNENNPSVSKAKTTFDELAEEMCHRRDVAFFKLEDSLHNYVASTKFGDEENKLTICEDTPQWFRGKGSENDGSVAVLRVRRYVHYYLSPTETDHKSNNLNANSVLHLWNQQRKRVIHSVVTDWDDVSVDKVSARAVFTPTSTGVSSAQEDTKQNEMADNIPRNATDFVKSDLVAFTVIHTTPTVLFFDRYRTAQLAFPWYRTIHAVLFVDFASSNQEAAAAAQVGNPPWPSYLSQTSENAQLLHDQKIAVQMFYDTALRYKEEHPSEDIVFLIIPSTETRIMSTFGVDIWTHLDEAFSQNAREKNRGLDEHAFASDLVGNSSASDKSRSAGLGYCYSTGVERRQRVLPVMMITDKSGRSQSQLSRYYLCSKDMFSSSHIEAKNGGTIGAFVDSFIDGAIGKPFIRSDEATSLLNVTPRRGIDVSPDNEGLSKSKINTANVTNESGVHLITGNNFHSMIIDRDETHSMVLMCTATCGHCKRFSIFWNELSSIVQAMNWRGTIDVMKIDVSKNDVLHKKVNVWDLPSVYYFPAGEKDEPIEMTLNNEKDADKAPNTNFDDGFAWVTSGYDIVEWMIKQGKLDLSALIKLDEMKLSEAIAANDETLVRESDTIELD